MHVMEVGVNEALKGHSQIISFCLPLDYFISLFPLPLLNIILDLTNTLVHTLH